ncbi:hypothetical protein [Bradyrhizobium erythrophlei]|uniref:Short stature homeobox protein n=1 Tax=Bradyrhizobium erythrophlei TaxID=1437360 RepID=A0A1H4XWY5_9BRAD|nr:hypothetical protein [Bradyrhizobium erythrophlei]SED10272.1 short stature homeobox protein [Bradyrhizobium erythrophlei]
MKTATIALATAFMFGSIAAASAQGGGGAGGGAGGGDSPAATTGQGAYSSPSAVDPGATQNDPKEKGTTSEGGTMIKDKTSKDHVKK